MNNNRFRDRFKYYLRKSGYQQQELAGQLNVEASTLSKWINGRNPWPVNAFIRICELLELTESERQELSSLAGFQDSRPGGRHLQDWGKAPDVSVFYGRKKVLAQLKQWIVNDRCRLVGILGIGGIGKTELATKLAKEIQDQFDYVIWRSLLNAPPVEEILSECIQFFAEQQQGNLPERIGRQISLLIDYLHQHRCLLVLDNVEAILQEGNRAGHYRAGYEEYGQLIQRVGETSHKSCLILTSREKPKELALLEGKNSPVRRYPLSGLELPVVRKMLDGKELFGQDKDWKDLNELYSGNPLALKLVSETIREVFDGEISRFLNEGKPISGDIWELLNQQFNRLSAPEQAIMFWLAIGREAVLLDSLQKNIVYLPVQETVQDALVSLGRRALVEQVSAGFALQNVVMEYVTNRLIGQMCAEIINGSITLFKSHALIKAQSKEYVRQSQERVILKPVAERLLSTLGHKKRITRLLADILSSLREKPLSGSAYAAGNVLNLLVHLGCDLTGFDFSHLAVWQAYLQGISLHDVNFAHADLTNSVFTDTFGRVHSVAFSPDGEILAGGTANGEIRLWRAADGKPLFTCGGDPDRVRSIAFSPKGHILASGGDDNRVRLWKISPDQSFVQQEQTDLKHGDIVWAVGFSPNGRILASGSRDGTVKLWDVESGECHDSLPGHTGGVTSVAFNREGDILATGGRDRTVKLWKINAEHPPQILQGHTDSVFSVAFHLSTGMLASGGADQTVRVWKVSIGENKSLQGHTGLVFSVAFNHNSDTLASGSYDETVRLWKVSTGQCFQIMQGHSNWVRSVAFSSDGQRLASGGDDQTVRLWDVETGKCLYTLQGYTNWVRSVAFSPNGETLASGGDDQTVRLWDVNTGKCLRTWSGHTKRVWAVAFSPNGRILASSSRDHTVRLWDVDIGKRRHILQGHTGRVRSIAFSPDGRTLASGSADQTVRLWDVSTGQCLQILPGHTDEVRSVAFSADGATLASGSSDHTVRLWNIGSKEYKTLSGHNKPVWVVAFSPDGNTLASGSDDQTIQLWDARTGERRKILRKHNKWVLSVAFSPDGRVLASGSSDRTVRLWDVSTGRCLDTFQEHTGWVWSVAFSPKGSTLASGSTDETIKLWKVKNQGKCFKTLRGERPYERMNVTGVTGLTRAQKASLKELGAIEIEKS